MIIYQNKQDKIGDNKIIQKQNDFCSWKLQSEKLSGHLPQNKFNYWEIWASEAAGKYLWWFYCINDILSEKVRIVKVRKMAKIWNQYNQVPHLTQDTTWKSNKTTINITNKSQEVSPFPAGDHKQWFSYMRILHLLHIILSLGCKVFISASLRMQWYCRLVMKNSILDS